VTVGALDRDAFHASDVARLRVQCIFTANNEGTLIRYRNGPLGGMCALQVENRAGESLESPEAMQSPSKHPLRRGLFERVPVDQKSTLHCVGSRWQLERRSVGGGDLQTEIVR